MHSWRLQVSSKPRSGPLLCSVVGDYHSRRIMEAYYDRRILPSSRPTFEKRSHRNTFRIHILSNIHTFHREGITPMRNLSPYLVAKCLEEKIGEGYNASKMTSGDVLLEVTKEEQSQKLSNLTSIGDIKVTISAHRSVNTRRGVISEDFLNLSDE